MGEECNSALRRLRIMYDTGICALEKQARALGGVGHVRLQEPHRMTHCQSWNSL